MAENKGILPSSTFNTLGNNSNKWEAVYANKLVGPLTGNATTATKATQDSEGQQINTTYIKGLSISNNALIYTKGNGTTGNVDLISAGTVQMFAGKTIPAGWLLCNGAAISRTTYSALYNVIGTTYGAGNGSTTFTLPNLIDRVVQGSATAGTYKEAGLPNITGEFTNQGLGFGTVGNFNGVFQKTADPAQNGVQYIYSTNANPKIIFNAANSNPIYGNSTTVQPPALTMLPIIKY